MQTIPFRASALTILFGEKARIRPLGDASVPILNSFWRGVNGRRPADRSGSASERPIRGIARPSRGQSPAAARSAVPSLEPVEKSLEFLTHSNDLCWHIGAAIGALGREALNIWQAGPLQVRPTGLLGTEGTGDEEWRGMATLHSDALSPQFGGYRPSANEEFMNPEQLAYFRVRLLAWKEEICRESRETMAALANGPIQEADLTDRASSETDWGIHLRTRDRQRKLIAKIDSALKRIESGEYGFCEVTGEPISLARLEARPIATMTVEAQERHEKNERISRED